MNPAAFRKQAIIVLIIAILLVLGSMWVNMVLKKTAIKDKPEVQRTDPDYIIENFKYYRFLPDGTPRYEAIGKKLTHYPIEDAYRIEKPILHMQNSSGQLQTVMAEEAYAEDFNTKITLTDKVRVEEEGTGGKAGRVLTTEYLLYYPDEEIAETDKEVTIKRGKNVLKGVGMKSNNATSELEMHSRVQVTIYPNGDKAEPPKKETEAKPDDAAQKADNSNPSGRVSVQL